LETALTERITISTSYGENIWPIWVDPIQLEAAIMNITINARDAMPKGGEIHFNVINTTIHEDNISNELQIKAGDFVQISISDQGEGMTSDIIEHIFEPFFTTK